MIIDYLKAIGGNALLSASNLLLSFVIFALYESDVFGFYALLVIFQSLTYSIVNSVYVAPLQEFVANKSAGKSKYYSGVVFSIALTFVFSALFLLYVWGYSSDFYFCLVVSIFLAVGVLRWILRSHYIMNMNINLCFYSDLFLSVSYLFCGLVVWMFSFDFTYLVLGLSLGLVVSFIPFFREFRFSNSISGSLFDSDYLEALRSKGKDAFLGALALEVSQNSHGYLISFAYGPQYFAPFALANTLFRPLGVVLAGLAQIERPRISIFVYERDLLSLEQSLSRLRRLSLSSWLGSMVLSVSAVYFILEFYPDKIDDLNSFLIILLGVSLVSLIRATRTALSVEIQARSMFKEIRDSVLLASIVAILLIVILLNLFPLEYTIFAVVVGEFVILFYLYRVGLRHG